MAKETLNTPWFGVPNNRQEALKIGHPYYFTGKPCKHGHLSNRDSKDRKCQECELIATRKRGRDPSMLAKNLVWCRANRDKRRAASKKTRAKHRNKVLQSMRDWYARNREIQSQKRKIWSLANKPKIYAMNAARRFRELQATPPWVSQFQSAIEAIYAERIRLTQETGIKYHVDHIYPLKGENCSGLHVPWNLQILPGSENIRKRNKSPEVITMSLTENGWRFLCVGSKSSVAVAGTFIEQILGS